MKSLHSIVAALAIMAGAVFATQTVAKKKVEAAPQQPVQKVALTTSSDSLSYAAGEALTNGLIPYIQQQFNVDTAYMADFIQGFRDAATMKNNPSYTARQAGAQIALMAQDRMLPSLQNDLNGTPDSLVAGLFYEGFTAALLKDSTLMTQEVADKYFQTRMEANAKVKSEKTLAEGKAWLAENAKKEGVKVTASGLQYKIITQGTGAKPTAEQEVTVKYEGRLIDGTVFDSSYKRNPQTNKFRCNQVISGWTEALQLMPVGSKWELYIPQELGYGAQATGNIPAYSTLIFTVELVDITK